MVDTNIGRLFQFPLRDTGFRGARSIRCGKSKDIGEYKETEREVNSAWRDQETLHGGDGLWAECGRMTWS